MFQITDVYYIPGFPGLYILLDGHKRGLMVESIVDGRRTFVSDRHMISSLALGGLFVTIEKTDKEPEKSVLMPFLEVFEKMKASSMACPSAKAGKAELMAYIKNVITNLDEEKTYISLIQKVVHWYALLDGKLIIAGNVAI